MTPAPLAQPDQPADLAALAVAARSGGHALDELVRATQPTVGRFCRSMLGSVDGPDAVQETYVRLLTALERYDPERPLLPWLLTIARRVCIDQVRASRRRQALPSRLQPVSPVTSSPDQGAVQELVGALEPGRRAAFVLTQVMGYDYAEAARICRVPVGTIRSRVHRARADLLRALQ